MAHWNRRAVVGAAVVALAGALVAGASAGVTGLTGRAASSRTLAADTRFFVPAPVGGYRMQEAALTATGQKSQAAALARMADTPQAVWFNSGTPARVERQVRLTVTKARAENTVPVLVAYDIPGRDCDQYSAGGARSDASYQAWIDAFAVGIGTAKAVVILEPDSLGTMPSNCGLPAGAAYPFTDSGRIADLVAAVADLEARPNTLVYLDGTHSAWQPVGVIAQRLIEAGVLQAQGFFLNASGYQYTDNNIAYGTWISDCIAYAQASGQVGAGAVTEGSYTGESPFFAKRCANQYWNGGPATSYEGAAMNNYVPWNDTVPYPAESPDADTVAGIDSAYAADLASVGATARTHFVIDTSRNGQGPDPINGGPDPDMPSYLAAPYDQPAAVISALAADNWCNSPGAGLGLAPTALTGVPLVDAYLWIKTPGESDGQCDAYGGIRAWDYAVYDPWHVATRGQAVFDPLWGTVDPRAGVWFDAQALQLANNASESRAAVGNKPPAP